jgi:hypothetical protein
MAPHLDAQDRTHGGARPVTGEVDLGTDNLLGLAAAPQRDEVLELPIDQVGIPRLGDADQEVARQP